MKNILALAFLFLSTSAFSQSLNRSGLDEYFKLLDENDKANISLAISQGGKAVYQNQSGFLSAKREEKINSETLFRIGSITKTFTAVIIFQLIEEGEISLETRLSTYFPKVKNAESITVAQLLGHQSGIQNFTDLPNFITYMTQQKTTAELLQIMESLDSDFEPGTEVKYSNSGYVLLGLMIEKVTGESYQSNLMQRIIDKLRLTHTSYGDRIEVDKNEAASQVFQMGRWMPFPAEGDMSIPFSAGSIVSTPSDLNEFLYALFHGKLVSEQSITEMKKLNGHLGHGVFPVPFGKKTGWGHNGRIDNFNSAAYYFEEGDMNVSLISSGTNTSFNDILIVALSGFYGEEIVMPNFNPIELSKSEWANYIGQFSSSTLPIEIEIATTENGLTAQATGQAAFLLTPFSKREFRYDLAGIIIEFAQIKNKVDYTSFTLKQGGQQFRFTKK